MNRSLLIVLLGLLIGGSTHAVYFHLRHPPGMDSLEGQLVWMKEELRLDDAQYARIRELHEASSPRLRALAVQVARMQAEFAAFEHTRRTADRVDFLEFARFVENRREINRECLESTRKLILASADVMNPTQRAHYLGLVAAAGPFQNIQVN